MLGEEEFERRWPWVERAFTGEPVNFTLDYRGHGSTTHLHFSYIPLRLDSGEVDGFVVVSQDLTQQRQEEGRLLQLSQRDALTGILNRAGFEQHMERTLHQGGGDSLALLYIDLDHFKPVNDKYGHPAGDQVLKLFAQRLVNLVRPTDAVARMGGDEFAIALINVHERGSAEMVADKVLAAAMTPFHVGGKLLKIGASVGVAFGADSTTGWGDLVERADAKLLTAKAAGRGRQVGATA